MSYSESNLKGDDDSRRERNRDWLEKFLFDILEKAKEELLEGISLF